MKFKGFIFICFLICLFSIASVVANDINEPIVASENQNNELIGIENHDGKIESVEKSNPDDTLSLTDNMADEIDNSSSGALVLSENYNGEDMSSSTYGDKNSMGLAVKDEDVLGISLSSTPSVHYNDECYFKVNSIGDFDGYFLVEKGSNVVTKIKLTGKGSFDYNAANLKSLGVYSIKINNINGQTVISSSFKVVKSPTDISVWAVKKGKKYVLKASVYGYYTNKVNLGTVKFKINGKSYYTKVKNSIAQVKVKLPLSKTKTYKFSGTYISNSKYGKSSAKDSIHVKGSKKVTTKKKSSSKKITLKLKKSGTGSGKYIKKAYIYAGYGDIYGHYVRTDFHGSLNGIKLIKANIYFKNNNNGKFKVKSKKLNKWGMSKTKLISGYTPIKVVIFYK